MSGDEAVRAQLQTMSKSLHRTSSKGLNTIASSGDSAGDELLADNFVPASALAAARGANGAALQVEIAHVSYANRVSEQAGGDTLHTQHSS